MLTIAKLSIGTGDIAVPRCYIIPMPLDTIPADTFPKHVRCRSCFFWVPVADLTFGTCDYCSGHDLGEEVY